MLQHIQTLQSRDPSAIKATRVTHLPHASHSCHTRHTAAEALPVSVLVSADRDPAPPPRGAAGEQGLHHAGVHGRAKPTTEVPTLLDVHARSGDGGSALLAEWENAERKSQTRGDSTSHRLRLPCQPKGRTPVRCAQRGGAGGLSVDVYQPARNRAPKTVSSNSPTTPGGPDAAEAERTGPLRLVLTRPQDARTRVKCHLRGLALATTARLSGGCTGGHRFSPAPLPLPYSTTSTCPRGTLHFNKYFRPGAARAVLSAVLKEEAAG